MPQLGDGGAARPVGRGRLRASHADRDQVIDTLKDAFVQGRLTKDELDSRVGQALASRTHADLAALTADLPAGLPLAKQLHKAIQPRSKNTTVKSGARLIAATTALTGGVWIGALLSQSEGQTLGALALTFTLIWLGVVILVGAVMLESRRPRRSNGQLPPTPDDRGRSSKRALTVDPARALRPGDHGRQRAAEASRRPMARPPFLREPRLTPSAVPLASPLLG